MDKLNEFMEYLGIHIISLEQDLEKIDYVNDQHFWRVKEAEILNTQHLLSVANGILDGGDDDNG